MRLPALVAAALLAAAPALAEDFPKSPKAGPPEPLPEAACDTAKPSDGAWLLGRWVAPMAKWEFTRDASGLAFRFESKSDLNADYGWKEGAVITGTVERLTGCTMHLAAGGGAFVFDGVLTDGGKIYGAAANKAGHHLRYVLRRER